MAQTTADTVAEALLEHHRADLERAVSQTRESGREQALTAFRPPGDEWDTTGLESGTATSVTIPPSPVGTFETISVHTHPIPGPVGFSVEDYLQFARFFVMSQPFDGEPTRGYAVVGQRFPDVEAATAVLHVVAPTEQLSRLPIFERHNVIGRTEEIAAQTPRADRELSYPQTDAIRDSFDPYTTETYRQFDVEPAATSAAAATAHAPAFRRSEDR